MTKAWLRIDDNHAVVCSWIYPVLGHRVYLEQIAHRHVFGATNSALKHQIGFEAKLLLKQVANTNNRPKTVWVGVAMGAQHNLAGLRQDTGESFEVGATTSVMKSETGAAAMSTAAVIGVAKTTAVACG